MKRIWVIGIPLLIWSCSTSSNLTDSGSSLYSNYQEDLTGSLPKYEDFKEASKQAVTESVSSSQAVDKDLSDLKKRIYDKNKSEPFFTGYTVLVFSGVDRNAAFKTRDDLTMYFPDLSPEMQYQQPRYLVKIGQYAYKMEAQQVFSRLKPIFPSARIMQDRFQRKEYTPSVTLDQNAPTKN
jgi:hypothetical protein